MLEGVSRVLTLRIQNGHSIGQFIVGHVMVTDDEINAQRLRIGDFIDCLNAAIQHNNEFDTLFGCIVQSLLADTITLLITVGNIVFNVGIELQ